MIAINLGDGRYLVVRGRVYKARSVRAANRKARALRIAQYVLEVLQ